MRRAAAFLGLAVLVLAPAILAQQSGASYSTCGPGRACTVKSLRVTSDAGIQFADGTRINTASGSSSLWSSSTDGGIYRLGGVSVGGISAGAVNVDGGDLTIAIAGANRHSLSANGTGYLCQNGGLLTVGGQVDARSGVTNAGSSDTTIGLLGRGNTAATAWVQVRAENSGTRLTTDGGKIQTWSNTENSTGNVAWIDGRGTFASQAIDLRLSDGGQALSMQGAARIGWQQTDGGAPLAWTSGPSFGEVSEHNETGSQYTITTAGVWYPWTATTVGYATGAPYLSGNSSGLTTGTLGVGTYLATWRLSARADNAGAQGSTLDATLLLNGTPQNNCQADGFLAANQTDRTTVGASCLLSIASGVSVQLAFTSDGSGDVIAVQHASVILVRVQ